MAGKYFQPSLTFRVGHCNVTHLVILDNEKNFDRSKRSSLFHQTKRKSKA